MYKKIVFPKAYASADVLLLAFKLARKKDKNVTFNYMMLTGGNHPINDVQGKSERQDIYYNELFAFLEKEELVIVSTNKFNFSPEEFDNLSRTVFVEETEDDFKEFEIISNFAGNYHFIGRQITNQDVFGLSVASGEMIQLTPKFKKLSKEETLQWQDTQLSKGGVTAQKLIESDKKTETVKTVQTSGIAKGDMIQESKQDKGIKASLTKLTEGTGIASVLSAAFLIAMASQESTTKTSMVQLDDEVNENGSRSQVNEDVPYSRRTLNPVPLRNRIERLSD